MNSVVPGLKYSTGWLEKRVLGVDFTAGSDAGSKGNQGSAHDKLVYWIPLRTKASASQAWLAKLPRMKATALPDRFLMLFHDGESSVTLKVATIDRKKDVEVQHSSLLSDILFLEVGDGTNDLVLGMGDGYSGDVTLTASNQVDRDDAAFIIYTLCREVYNITLNTTDSMKMNVLGYSMAAHGEVFRKFPQLKSLLPLPENTSDMLGGATGQGLNEDELEAEALLDELQAKEGVATASPDQLQAILQRDLGNINMDIIDVLIEWENAGLSFGDDNGGPSSSGKLQSSSSSSSSVDSSSSSQDKEDICESLEAIAQTRTSLEYVEFWLTDQIDRLQATKDMLSQIEEESRTLERTYLNLSTVEDTLEAVTQGMKFEPADEATLLEFCRDVGRAVKDRDIHQKLAQACEGLDFLMVQIKEKLTFRMNQGPSAMAAGLSASGSREGGEDLFYRTKSLSQQRAKIAAVLDDACLVLSTTASTVFHDVLKHPTMPRLPTSASLEAAVRSGVLVYCGKDPIAPPTQVIPDRGTDMPASCDLPAVNILLRAQENFHVHIRRLAPIMKHLEDVDFSTLDKFRAGYLDAAQSLLYRPLIKMLRNEILAYTQGGFPPGYAGHLMNSAGSIAGGIAGGIADGLARLPSTNLVRNMSTKPGIDSSSNNSDITVDKQPKGFSMRPWVALELFLQLTAPLVVAEETILSMFYRTAVLAPDVETLFAAIEKAIDRIAASAGGAGDGRDTNAQALMGMLVVLNRFESHPAQSTYLIALTAATKSKLTTRLEAHLARYVQTLKATKVDMKRIGVLQPVHAFPDLINSLLVMSVGRVPYVHDTCGAITSALMAFIESAAVLNTKYADVIRIANLSFIEHFLASKVSQSETLRTYLKRTSQMKEEASLRYVDWMIAYEFPQFANLCARITEVREQVRSDELALYVRRHDVATVVTETDTRKVDAAVKEMFKRLEKHFGATDVADLELRSDMWTRIRTVFSERLGNLAASAEASYRLTLKCDTTYSEKTFLSYERNFI